MRWYRSIGTTYSYSMSKHLVRTLSILLALALSACGGGGGSGDESAADPQISGACSFRVVNGNACPAGKGPLALLAALDQAGNLTAICSGAFIARDKVLSAAHCSELAAFGSVVVYTGDQSAPVTNIAVDPRYTEATEEGMTHDTAIFSLGREIEITPLPLLASTAPQVGDRLLLYGFGQDENGGTSAEALLGNGAKRAELEVISIDNGMIEANFDTNEQGGCVGDSGGPVLAQNNSGEWAIAAVVRGGTLGNCLAGTVEIFLGVQTLGSTDFILSQVPTAALR